MLGRAGVLGLAFALLAGLPMGAALAVDRDDVVLKREDDQAEVAVMDDDGDDGDDSGNTGNSGNTSGVNSNDATGSRHTSVSRNRDRSRGDLTRDWTKDGGDRTRDHSRHHTNDGSRNDTR